MRCLSPSILLSCLIAFFICGCVTSLPDLADAARAAADSEASAQRAVTAGEMAANALRNAIAFNDRAEQELLIAIRNHDWRKSEAAKESLAAAGRDLAVAWKMLEEIHVLVASAQAASLASLAAAEETSMLAGDRGKAGKARARTLAQAAVATRAADDAAELAEKLKSKWLVPHGDVAGARAGQADARTVSPEDK